ncbi:unnamed protein product [Phyllotreta striolata]|uniref:Uncharacterized protein n=1 Tax=Phyllotreta striolata TaxID=444603 RepID=A0A9N9XL34_PHYSR|nr:unnamed protein product [Phyllotreta striolata]
MSAAMRSTLQTVPESLEVTKNADPTIGSTGQTTKSSAKPILLDDRAYRPRNSSSTNKVWFLQNERANK